MTNYYVYYRVDAKRADELRPAIAALFATIRARTGVLGRWMRRRDDPTTFMEVYEGIVEEALFEELMAKEASALGLERRVERFVCA